MTLEQLRIFTAVAACQHVTRAAERLNMTQSAVSAAIAALEVRHGVKLFDRIGRSILLNGAGQQFLEEAQKVLAAAQAAEAVLNDLSGLGRGALTIMASQTVGAYWLPGCLAAFHQGFPGIRLQVSLGNTTEVTQAVLEGRAELGLTEGTNAPRGLLSRQIAEDEMIVVVSPFHPWARPGAVVDDLRDSAWILREAGSGTRQAFVRLLEAAGLSLDAIDIELELPGNAAVIGAVENGLTASLVSRSVVAAPLQYGRLALAPVAPLPRPYFLLRHPERYRSKSAEAFERLLENKA